MSWQSREARRDKPGVPQSSSLNGWVDSVAVNWNEKQEAGWNLSDNEELRDWVSSQLFHQPRVWSWIQCLGHFSFLNYKLKRLENFTAGSFLRWIVCDLRDIMWIRQVWQSLNVKNMKLSRMWLRTLNELQTKGEHSPWSCCTERNYPGEKGMWVWREYGTVFLGAYFPEVILCFLYSLNVRTDPLFYVYLVCDQDGIAEH